LATSLATPDSVRTLQRRLYLKAKAEPDYRFYLLHDKIHRADVLRHAYELVRANRGAPGVDGVIRNPVDQFGLVGRGHQWKSVCGLMTAAPR
jgi:RNA-directed DNA polymerase